MVKPSSKLRPLIYLLARSERLGKGLFEKRSSTALRIIQNLKSKRKRYTYKVKQRIRHIPESYK
jgi:hypothetical protein